ncbi:MAG: LysR family transcriptional regulator [Pseudomonas sp.]|nr:LysR family transcriptional regulator [Pseudomonas sp.]
MNRYHQLHIFHSVAQHTSLAGAARALNVAGPTVIRAMAALEQRLGVSLIERTTQGISLTEAGQRFAADCAKLLTQVEQADAFAKGLQVHAKGLLRVVMPPILSPSISVPLLLDYLDRYPEVRLQVDYRPDLPSAHEPPWDVVVWAGQLPSSSLVAIRVGHLPEGVPVQVVYRDGLKASARVRSFVDLAVPWLRGHQKLVE